MAFLLRDVGDGHLRSVRGQALHVDHVCGGDDGAAFEVRHGDHESVYRVLRSSGDAAEKWSTVSSCQ